MGLVETTIEDFFGIRVISLKGGNLYDKGFQYGAFLKSRLHSTLDLLVKKYNEYGVSYQEMAEKAQYFYDRYEDKYKPVLDGISAGSKLSIDDVKILNGMETIYSLITSKITKMDKIQDAEHYELVHCTFISIPQEKTSISEKFIGRNYDFPPEIYGDIAANLVITIFNDDNDIPAAIIGMPGQIYCASCTNIHGLFMELNNGMASGGESVAQNSKSMLSSMMSTILSSKDLETADKKLEFMESDYSLIIGVADPKRTKLYEFSSNKELGMKTYSPTPDEIHVNTNFYLNSTWNELVPTPTDHTTWRGVTRRDNLIDLANSSNEYDLKSMQAMMDTKIEDGGAKWEATIYQIIFKPDSNYLSIKRNFAAHEDWVDIDLNPFYGELIN